MIRGKNAFLYWQAKGETKNDAFYRIIIAEQLWGGNSKRMQASDDTILLSTVCSTRRKTYYIGSCAHCGEQASAAAVTPQLAARECLSMCLQTCDRDDCPLTHEDWEATFDAPQTA